MSSYAAPESAAPELPAHVVTAVLVAHDGARWLPDVLRGLLGQERPVQRVVAADTGSADDSARLLTEALGAERVTHLARRTGFGTAVAEAARTAGVPTPDDLPYLRRPSSWDPVNRQWRDSAHELPELPHGEPVQWLWLLHDDSAPEPGALAALLRVADAQPQAAVIGPKLRGWYDRRQLLETGVSIAASGRRWTGLDRREQDQGQHDGVRDVLSVSTAGMLIRRDVFEQLGGFDARLPLMRDDVDLCWRAHQAGHRVLIATDAVLRHAEAAARERRSIDCAGRGVAGPHRVDKAGAAYTLLANARAAALPWIVFRLVLGTVLRTLAYLVGKVPGQALDEIAGLAQVLLNPFRVLSGRRRRGRGTVPPAELRPLFPGRGATVRATVEQVVSNVAGRSEPERSGGGRHGGAVESGPGGDDADFLEIEQFSRLRQLARKPGPLLFAALLLVSLVACRELLGGGSLMGGALLPAPDRAGELWASWAHGWHPVGVGGTQGAPPYLALLAGFAALLLGSTHTALTVLLVCSVPLAGLVAYFASRPLVPSRLLRAWAAVTYAFLPAATGALAEGRIGTCVLAVLLPLIARAAVAASGLTGRPGWRPAWAYALLLTVATAFTPIVWPLAAVLAAALLGYRAATDRALPTACGLRQLAALATPMLVLAPWSLQLLASPSRFLTEAGMELRPPAVSAVDLLLVSPGGSGAGPVLLLAGLVLAALAALLRGERELPIRTAWAVALAGFLFAALSAGEWAGPATLVYGLALLCAAVLGADGARHRVAEQSFGWRQPLAVLIAAACLLAPLALAAGWMWRGADGPLQRRDPVQVPAFVAAESATSDQPRTLVLGGTSGEATYTLVRGAGARLGDAELTASGPVSRQLDAVVAGLVAGSGADQTKGLSAFAVRYVLVRNDEPAARAMGRVLDATPGLTHLSEQPGGALWRVDRPVARAAIESADSSAPVLVAAGPVGVDTRIGPGPQGRVLRLADAHAAGWQAALDGRKLKPVELDGWAQGFELPAEGGRLTVRYATSAAHTAWIWAQAGALLVVVVLALPGRRREMDDDLPEADAVVQGHTAGAGVPAQPVDGEGRRARRLRAAAEASAETSAETGATQDDAEPEQEEPRPEPVPGQYAAVPQQPSYGDWDTSAYAVPQYGGSGGHGYAGPQAYDSGPQGYDGAPDDSRAYGTAQAYDIGSPAYEGERAPQTYSAYDGADSGYLQPPAQPAPDTFHPFGERPQQRRDGSDQQ
ncbi:glycosyltransferase [Streptomyces polyrhachis]|uniref:Glycosyltransferase n=1 Tax=Streptomyces polyrhachis TaxID=1282885 RepID=A0ABW2GP74_9ACTN